MNYNLSDFLTSIKLNTHKFEELSFAGSYFTMPKKELNNVLFAETNDKEDQATIENSPIAGSYINVDENKKSLMARITEKISNIFKPKPKAYKLTDGQSVEIDGTMPGNPIAKFFNRIADSIDKITGKKKEILDATTVRNEPQIIANSPAVIDSNAKTNQDPTLLNPAQTQNPNIVIPGQTGKVNSTGSYINSKPAPKIGPETIDVDKEDVLRENKDMITDLLKKSDEKATTEPQTPVQPQVATREDNSDDFIK